VIPWLVYALECDKRGVTLGYLTDLTDEQWAWLEPIFPAQEGRGRLKARRNPHVHISLILKSYWQSKPHTKQS